MLELHGYQKRAVDYIVNKLRCALWLDLGLGKTAITLKAIEKLKERGEVKKVVVIAPQRLLKSVWVWECLKWTKLSIKVVDGSPVTRVKKMNEPADIYVVSRDLMKWAVANKLFANTNMVVIDESSGFGSSKSERFRELRKVIFGISRVVLLSATPADNYIKLWSQIYLLDGGKRLGKYITKYREKYFNYRIINGIVVYTDLHDGAKEEINKLVSDVCMSMSAEDYLQLPELRINDIKIDLNAGTMAKYKRFKKSYVYEDIAAANAAVLTNKLQQLSAGFLYDERGAAVEISHEKMDALKEMLEEIPGQVLIFSTYKRNNKYLDEFARALSSDKAVEDFTRGKFRVAYANAVSAGYGLNLQCASTVIFLDLVWSYEVYKQAIGRVYRQGQAQRVTVHRLVASGTIDERIVSVLERKADDSNALMEAVKAEIKGG